MPALLSNAQAFLIALGVIVFVHELGHFVVAKAFGVRVLVFSLGFGKRLWGFDFKGTDCRISVIPLGGYVRMSGELPEERSGEPGDFSAKPRWQRILVYVAGPAMNVVLSIGLFTWVFMDGYYVQAVQETPSVVGTVEAGSPAEVAGLRPGDRIVAVEGDAVEKWKDVDFVFLTSPGRPVEVELERDGIRHAVAVVPREVERYGYGDAGAYPPEVTQVSSVIEGTPADGAGFEPGDVIRAVDGQPIDGRDDFVSYIKSHGAKTIAVQVLRGDRQLLLSVKPAEEEGSYSIGVYLGLSRRLPFREAVVASVLHNVEIITKSVQLLGKLLTNEIAPKSALSGPIEIARWSGQAARRGVKHLIYTMGILSVSIGFMNLLPIPVLDGGHIFILSIESTLRRDLSRVLKERITQVGFMMLMTLMAVVIFFDLAKNLPALFPGT